MDGFRQAVKDSNFDFASLAFEAFSRLAQEPAASAALRRAGALEAFVATLKSAEADVRSTHNGVFSVGQLCIDPSWRPLLAAADIGPRIFALLLHRHGRPDTVKTASQVLRVMAGGAADAVSRKAIMDAGAAAALVNALARWKADAAAAGEICAAIGDIGVKDDCNVQLGRAGAMPEVIAVMRNHPGNPTVAHYALGAVAALVYNADNGAALARDAAGVAALLEMLRRCEATEIVAKAGLASLLRLALDHPSLPRLVRDATPAVLSAMRRHADSSSIADSALGALNNLVHEPEHRGAVVKAGGLTAVLEAMQKHKGNGTVSETGCTVLQTIFDPSTTDPDVRRIHFKNPGVPKAVTQALRTHGRRPMLALQGSSLLQNLCIDAAADDATVETRPALIRDGAVQAFAAVIKEQAPGGAAVHAAVKGLALLTKELHKSPETAAELARVPATATAVAALRAGLRGNDTTVAKYASTALAGLMMIPSEPGAGHASAQSPTS